jgi:hypothetical protein
MATTTLSVVLGWYCVGMLAIIGVKLLLDLPRLSSSTITQSSARLFRLLALIWLLLALAHCLALFVLQLQLATEAKYVAAAFGWWGLVNMILAMNLSANLDKLPEKTLRSALWWALGINVAVLMVWLLALSVPSITMATPAETTLLVSMFAAIAMGIFLLPILWRLQHAK